MSSPRVLTRLVSAASATALAGSALVLGAGAAQAAPLMACQWIDTEYTQTYDCGEPADPIEFVDIVECWSMPPSERTYVSTKVPGEPWRKNRDVTVTINESKDCSDGFPYRTRVRIPADMLAEMATTRLRLTMPAAAGELPDGTAYEYRKTTVKYGVCLMPGDATDWCPKR